MPEQRIGRYEIVRALGRGAMGVVYLARDPLIDREVALKTLRVDLDAEYTAEFRERFLREARAAGRLSHAGIVTIHDVGEDPATGLVFIAMEYIKGRDLKQMLAEGHRFRASEAARIAADVAEALHYAHSMGVVHRDIKPANIILTADGSAKITDFGIARLESSNLTVEGQFIGTPNFMSPEQITGRTVDGRSDIFSLGVVLFTLLTGARPFAGETMHEVTLKVVQDPCPIPSTLAPQIPPAFNPVILKCLEKEPDKRFQNGAELARVLGALARALVERDAGDPARTGVFQPDLETRSDLLDTEVGRREDAGPVRRDFTSPRRPGQRTMREALFERLRVPEPLTRDVNPTWVRAIAGVAAGLCFGWIVLLAAQRDAGPFFAPSDGAVRNLHLAAQRAFAARGLLDAGHLDDAVRTASLALDQAPSSPAIRRTLGQANRRLRLERSSAETRQRVADLVEEGRSAYRQGRYRAAEQHFQAALELDPDDELATSYLDLARERQRRSRPVASRVQTAPRRDAAVLPLVAPTPMAAPTPGTSRVTVFFNSPITTGNVTVTRNDAVLAEIPFDFTAKGFLGIKRHGTGVVKRVLMTASGRQTIGVQLRNAERGLTGAATFERTLGAGSDWTLRIDLPRPGAEPSFYLVETRR